MDRRNRSGLGDLPPNGGVFRGREPRWGSSDGDLTETKYHRRDVPDLIGDKINPNR